MSFFQDLKDDLSEAVNELMINENEEEELKEEVFEDPADDDDSVIDEETEEVGDTQTDDLLAEADLLFSPEEIASLAGEAEAGSSAGENPELSSEELSYEESSLGEEQVEADPVEAEIPVDTAEVEMTAVENEEIAIPEPEVTPEIVDIVAHPVGSVTTVEEASVEEASVEEAPVEEASVSEESVKEDVVNVDSVEEPAVEAASVAETLVEETTAEETPDSVMKQSSLLGDIDLNSMLESIQSELNAQKDSMETEEELSAIVENSVKEEAGNDASGEDEDNIEGQMSLEEMFSGIPAVLPETESDKAAEVIEPEKEAVAADTTTEDEAKKPAPEAKEPEQAVKESAPEIKEPESEVPEVKEEKKPARKSTRRKKASTTGTTSAASAKAAVNIPDDRVLSDETAQLLAGVKITGNIISDGNMELGGEVEGDIDILGKINVSGTVCGNIKAGEIYAEGAEINGSITCEGSVKIGQGAVIIGGINGASAVIAGAVKGNIDVKGPVILADTAIVMGDIRSASVQISNGAAIEGMCSQVYAEVNPGTFFADFDKAKK
ncbi:MAG: polymer-forming cytoskeletal protein [Lachnospiraceae bacterium]|nr:polymer-forming cytoskeletal protein [Lachnospiraceae bacterium]